jgi:hypothetical protein
VYQVAAVLDIDEAVIVEPEDVESHVTGAPRHAEQLVELRSAGLVDRDYLAVETHRT